MQAVLTRFFVDRVLVIPTAELLHFDAFAVVDARLHRDVVTTFAFFAGQRDLEPLVICFACHLEVLSRRLYQNRLFQNLGDAARTNSTTTLTNREP